MLFSDRLFYGRMFSSPDGDSGGSAGSGSGGGDGGSESDGDPGGDRGTGNQSGDESGDEPTNASDAPGPEDRSEADAALTAIQRERDEARANARRIDRVLKDTQRQLAELKNAGRSEEERRADELKAAGARADAAEQRLRDATAKVAVADAATRSNAISVNAVFALVRGRLEYDEEGKPTNVAAVIAEAREQEPALFRASAGRGNGADRDTGDDPEVRPGVARMADAYARHSRSAGRTR